MNTKKIRDFSHEMIKQLGLVQAIPLPFIEEEYSFKSSVEIANRVNILHIFYAIYLCGKESYITFREVARENKYDRYLTSKERKILHTGEINEQDIINFSWFKESVKTLLWAGSFLEEDLTHSFVECDFSLYYSLIPPENPDSAFINNFRLREKKIILQHLDFYYCLHWYCKHYALDIVNAEVLIDPSVIFERRKALEWLASSDDWDHVFLDT